VTRTTVLNAILRCEMKADAADAGDSPAPVEAIPATHAVKGLSTLFKDGKPVLQWVKTTKQQVADELRWQAIEQAMATHEGAVKRSTIPKLPLDKDLLNIVVFGDPHIGMLAQKRETGDADWDLKICDETMTRATQAIVTRMPRAKKALLVDIGDLFHHESNAQVTPRSGHKLDCDSRFVQVAETGCRIMRKLTDCLLESHETVDVAVVPGNHDPDGARWVRLWLSAVYSNEPRVNILDNANPYMYYRFGENLVGMHHGDGAKLDKLPSIMASDQRKLWGDTAHHRWLCGHHHTYEAKSFPDCLVEKFPTLAPLDYYAAHAGYRSERSLNSITLSSRNGEICRAKVFASECE
jgi:hypothetical protein